MQPFSADFQLHLKFWPLDLIEKCLIFLAICKPQQYPFQVLEVELRFKTHRRSLVQILFLIRVITEALSFLLTSAPKHVHTLST